LRFDREHFVCNDLARETEGREFAFDERGLFCERRARKR
jgi:hypothetical protein